MTQPGKLEDRKRNSTEMKKIDILTGWAKYREEKCVQVRLGRWLCSVN